jgi:hypothetical protein
VSDSPLDDLIYRARSSIYNLLERYAFPGCPDPCPEPADEMGLPAHALHRSGDNLEGPLDLVADAATDAVRPVLEEIFHDRARWLAFIERGMTEHMQFGLVKDDGTTEMLPCADWCVACKLEELAQYRTGKPPGEPRLRGCAKWQHKIEHDAHDWEHPLEGTLRCVGWLD